ncbi:CBS domain-containing protein [Kaarinaea lacus]
MKIQDIMSTNVESVLPEKTLRRVAQKMVELDIGSVPVISEQGELLGMITDRDISCFAIAMGHEPNSTEVQKVMTREVFTCYEDQDINDAANIMEEKHIRRLMVLNRDNRVTGIVTVEDLARRSHELAGAVLEAAIPIH